MALPATHAVNSSGTGPVKSVAVVGAGVSGLAAAYRLKSNGVGVTVFEAEDRAGGLIRSGSQDGFIWDEGANTMTESEAVVGKLIDDLGLRGMQQFPLSQSKRYIARNGMPEMVPFNPIALASSNILSTKSKLNIILEPFMWKKSKVKVSDEHQGEREIEYELKFLDNTSLNTNSDKVVFNKQDIFPDICVGQFFERHFGKEVVDFIIDPFVAGTSAGDPESLSMRHAFPEIWNLEKNFGSLIVGAIRHKFSNKKESSQKRKVQRGSFSFHGGMQTLVNTLCTHLDGNLKLGSKVLSLSCGLDETPHNWSITCTSNSANQKDLSQDQYFDAVIMTAPISKVQDMKFKKGGQLFELNFLPKVDYLPLSVLVTSFRKQDVRRPLKGFGVLVPSHEQENGLRTLGTLFSSMMFPDRVPSDQCLYTTFIGGSRSRELAGASVDHLKHIVVSDLQKLLGVEGQPTFIKHVHWRNAFPLYGPYYGLVIDGINRMEETLPGFFYAGNHKNGLSVGKALASGSKAADLVMAYLMMDSSNNQDKK